MSLRLAFALAALAALGACGGKTDESAVSGEVLEGSISDAMLPLDKLTSQPPLAEPEAAAKARAQASDGVGAAIETGDAEPAADPSAEPTPQAEPAAEAE